jgi:hypothetical protein
MNRIAKLYGCQTARQIELKNIIAVYTQHVSDIEAEMRDISNAKELRRLNKCCEDFESVIADAEQELAEIEAQNTFAKSVDYTMRMHNELFGEMA